ncbi:CbtA family protein [Methyloprofundus sp.]|uniref:CbtA family protein n=1 Tax=Methyloprofundus sp. TaxID=2020875 RepID=UPI003D0F301A
MYFRQIFLISCLSAIAASIGFSLYQWFLVNPIIFAAELYELAEPLAANEIQQAEPWAPEDGIERGLYTLLANFLMSLAYSLLLVCGMVFRGSSSMLKGLAWGMAAYLSVFLAPALGLPPEIPGMQAADLAQRQNWWLLTVCLTAIGLAVLAFSPRYYKGAGLILILLPQLIGAPVAEIHGFSHPDPDAVIMLTKLWHQFILQTSIANALLWFIIGTSTGFLSHKFIDAVPPLPANKLTKA